MNRFLALKLELWGNEFLWFSFLLRAWWATEFGFVFHHSWSPKPRGGNGSAETYH